MDTEDQKRRVLVNLHHGRKEEALIKAIIPTTGGKKFQLDFGIDQTALVEDWQIMEQRVGTRPCPS